MTIEKIMSRDVVTIKEKDNLTNAIRKMKDNKVRHLPVVDRSGHLVGIVTDRDLKEASASDATTLEIHELLYLLDKVEIQNIMSRNVVTGSKSMTIKNAALTMIEKNIGSLPILEDKNLIGIITTTDLLRHCAGLHED